MVNNFISGFKEHLPLFCPSTMTAYMQVGYRNVDPSNPYKGGIRKKTWDEIVRRIFSLWKVNAIIPQNQNNKKESKQCIIVQIEALKNEHSVFVHFVYILTIAVQTTLNKIIHLLKKGH